MSLLDVPSGERMDVEYLADLYACVVAIEQMEKAYRREYITEAQYTAAVDRLLKKYSTTVASLSAAKNPHFVSSERFLQEYCSQYHSAISTIKMGPVSSASNSKLFLARQVMDCTQLFITLLDALRLQQTSVDKLNPLLADLIGCLRKVNVTDRDFYQRLVRWHDQLNGMSAADVLEPESVRQFEYDLDRGYSDLRPYEAPAVNVRGSGETSDETELEQGIHRDHKIQKASRYALYLLSLRLYIHMSLWTRTPFLKLGLHLKGIQIAGSLLSISTDTGRGKLCISAPQASVSHTYTYSFASVSLHLFSATTHSRRLKCLADR
eukprot:gene11073-7704_t